MNMTFEQWKAADEATRVQFEAECYERGTPRQIGELAEQAAKALGKELVNHRQITAVASGEDNKTRRSILLVTTSLGAGQKLLEVPDKFAGFPVVQVGVAQRKEDYLRRLEFALRAANLPQDTIDHWLEHFNKELRNIGSAYYVETPGRWIAEALIAATVKDCLTGKPRVELRGELWAAITDFFKEADPVRIGFELTAMSRLRTVFQRIFAGYGVEIGQ